MCLFPQSKGKKPPMASNGVMGKGKAPSGQQKKPDSAAGVKRTPSSKSTFRLPCCVSHLQPQTVQIQDINHPLPACRCPRQEPMMDLCCFLNPNYCLAFTMLRIPLLFSYSANCVSNLYFANTVVSMLPLKPPSLKNILEPKKLPKTYQAHLYLLS